MFGSERAFFSNARAESHWFRNKDGIERQTIQEIRTDEKKEANLPYIAQRNLKLKLRTLIYSPIKLFLLLINMRFNK